MDRPTSIFDPAPASDYQIELPSVSVAGQAMSGGMAVQRNGIQLVLAWPHRPLLLVYLGESAKGTADVYDLKMGESVNQFVGLGNLLFRGGALSANGEYLAYQLAFQFGLMRAGKPRPVYNEQSPDKHFFFFSGDQFLSGASRARRFSIPLSGNSKEAVVDIGSRVGGLSIDQQDLALSPTGRYIGVLPSMREDYTILDTQSWKPVGQLVQGRSDKIRSVCFSHDGEYLFVHSGGAVESLAKLRVSDGSAVATKVFPSAQWSGYKIKKSMNGPLIEAFPGDQHLIINGRGIFDTNSLEFVKTLDPGIPFIGNRPISATQVLALQGDALVPLTCL